ncbi:hypothetical protein Mgra_00005564 [Meloidogyne graminicola]|uniref:Uncharacterized protein n=1 Tax=Meloidogyne graminicola TaxID=189291 RepID=A0A8S9ZNU6_9BILA|nr:hypothetical protein Mgra_00005564 [Meloidogyne graminicola]
MEIKNRIKFKILIFFILFDFNNAAVHWERIFLLRGLNWNCLDYIGEITTSKIIYIFIGKKYKKKDGEQYFIAINEYKIRHLFKQLKPSILKEFLAISNT